MRPRQDVHGRVHGSSLWAGEGLEKPCSTRGQTSGCRGPRRTQLGHLLSPCVSVRSRRRRRPDGVGPGVGCAVSLQPRGQQGSPGAWVSAEGPRRHGVTPDGFTRAHERQDSAQGMR